MMFTLLFITITVTEAQLEIAPLDSLKASLKKYHHRAWEADRNEFTYKLKGKAWAHIPTVGLVFGLPSINWNTREIYNIKRDKRMKEAKLQQIDRSHELNYNEAFNQLRIEYEKYQVQVQQLHSQRELLNLEREIFKIHQEAYDKREIAPLEFLQKKKVLLTASDSYQQSTALLELTKLEIYQLAHYGIEKKSIHYTEQEVDDLGAENGLHQSRNQTP